jgi:ferritin-like protein
MSNYHEPAEELSATVRDIARALNSLKEEIEAIDWYQQRVTTCSDVQLKKILEHNRNEEMEHACMALEWLRRNMNGWDASLRKYLFTTREVTKIES